MRRLRFVDTAGAIFFASSFLQDAIPKLPKNKALENFLKSAYFLRKKQLRELVWLSRSALGLQLEQIIPS
jgi:hypothetical protein